MEEDRTERMDAYLAGELREDAARLVEEELRGDPVAREEFVIQARMDAALQALMTDEQAEQNFAQGVMAVVQTEPERSLAKSVLTEILDEREAAARIHRPRAFDWWVWTKTAAIAAVAAVAAIWILQSVQLGVEKAAPHPTFLARLTFDEEAQWGEESLQAREDGWLEAGRLHLKSGLAEVTFGSGARVMLEGPVVFDIEQTNRGFLKRGRLTAEVPEPASGFVVNTPMMNVVDLGTRFGLKVKNNSGESEIHVMQGVVEVSRSRGRSVPLVLTEGLAVLADRRLQSQLKPVVYAGHQFELPRENLPTMANHLHYGFDEASGASIDDTGSGLSGGPFDTSLLSEAGNTSQASPKRTAGVLGRGLVFEPGDRLESNGLSVAAYGAQPWSVMFWMKIPPKAGQNGEREFFTWGSGEQAWKLHWNGESDLGPEGAIRVDYGQGSAVGTTDLRDGRWHHVALVYIGTGRDGADPADVTTHTRFYVDGKLEALSGGKSASMDVLDQDIEEPGSSTFTLGGDGSFEGWLDEFYLLEMAASPASILELYQQGAEMVRNRTDDQEIR